MAGDAGDASTSDLSFGGADSDGEPVDVTGGGGKTVCAAGATQLCHCTATAQGVQICEKDGASWGPCKCKTTTPEDAGGGFDPPEDVGGGFDPPDAGGEEDTGVVNSGDCPDRSKQVYVLAADTTLLRFYPDTLQLTPVGKIKCPQPGGGEPFAMSIDRNATAWVLYKKGLFSGGGLFKVSTKDASCAATTYQPGQAGFELFGMGFSADSPGSKSETLFIAGGSALSGTVAGRSTSSLWRTRGRARAPGWRGASPSSRRPPSTSTSPTKPERS